MSVYEEIQVSVNLMEQQSDLYRPTAFWRTASAQIIEETKCQGLENFRRLDCSLMFFVPTYGLPGNGLSPRVVDQTLALVKADQQNPKQKAYVERALNGYESALADYRVLLAASSPDFCLDLTSFSESEIGNPIEHFEFEGKNYSRSALNYLLGLSFAQKHINFSDVNVVLEVGGGFGTLGEILLKTDDSIKYIDVDIPPTAHFSNFYLKEVFGAENVSSFPDLEPLDEISIKNLKRASVLCSWQLEKLVGKIDFFVNYISFQEMEREVVNNYLSHVSRLGAKWVMLRNLREGKQVKKDNGLGVDKPIKSADYGDMLGSAYELVAQNVMPFGFKTVDGYHSEILIFKLKD